MDLPKVWLRWVGSYLHSSVSAYRFVLRSSFCILHSAFFILHSSFFILHSSFFVSQRYIPVLLGPGWNRRLFWSISSALMRARTGFSFSARWHRQCYAARRLHIRVGELLAVFSHQFGFARRRKYFGLFQVAAEDDAHRAPSAAPVTASFGGRPDQVHIPADVLGRHQRTYSCRRKELCA